MDLQIKPALAALDSGSPAQQAPDGRRGDAAPSLPGPHQTAARSVDGGSLKSSDMALMFGAGIVAQQAVTGQPSFWLDRSVAKAIRRKQARGAGSAQIVKSGASDWLATPYRVPAAAIDSQPWQELDGWLVTSENGVAARSPRDVVEEGATGCLSGLSASAFSGEADTGSRGRHQKGALAWFRQARAACGPLRSRTGR